MIRIPKSRSVMPILAFALCLASVGCPYFLESYFATVAGKYGITYMYTGYPSTHNNVLNINKDGTLRAETAEPLFGGTNPAKGTWSQDKDKVHMEFAGTDGSYPVQSTFDGVLKDKDGKEIKDGTWSHTYQIGSTSYPYSGTWTAIKN